MLSPETFVVMDRLYGTLHDKIETWRLMKKQNKGVLLGYGANKNILKELLKERLLVAYDLAAAFNYLHSQR